MSDKNFMTCLCSKAVGDKPVISQALIEYQHLTSGFCPWFLQWYPIGYSCYDITITYIPLKPYFKETKCAV